MHSKKQYIHKIQSNMTSYFFVYGMLNKAERGIMMYRLTSSVTVK